MGMYWAGWNVRGLLSVADGLYVCHGSLVCFNQLLQQEVSHDKGLSFKSFEVPLNFPFWIYGHSYPVYKKVYFFAF